MSAIAVERRQPAAARTMLVALSFVAGSLLVPAATDRIVPASVAETEATGRLPIAFEPNVGQADDDVRFLARSGAATTFLTATGAVFRVGAEPSASISMDVVGADRAARTRGVAKLDGVVNDYTSSDRSEWRSGIPTYERVTYERILPGVDLDFYGRRGGVEYDFIVAPGTDPGSIALDFTGVDALRIDRNGDLLIETSLGTVVHDRPVAYQSDAGRSIAVDAAWDVSGARASFEIGHYDRSAELVIDPLAALAYSTFMGGGQPDSVLAIAVNAQGNAFVTGITSSADFPTTAGAFDRTYGGGFTQDVFVAKLNASGSALVYSTFMGGAGNDDGRGIAVDASGNAYITGSAEAGFPTTAGAFDQTISGTKDAYVAKLAANGGSLVYSTLVGGGNVDFGHGVDVDGAGAAYVVGVSRSPDFPTTAGAFDETPNGDFDGFLTKIDSAGGSLTYSTMLGSAQTDTAADVIVNNGVAAVSGGTFGAAFPTTANAFDRTHNGGNDVFILAVNQLGSGLIVSTFLGGGGNDNVEGFAEGGFGVAVAGSTDSADFPTTAGAFDRTNGGGGDAFVTTFDDDLGLLGSTFLGSTGIDLARHLTGGSDFVLVGGDTDSVAFPVTAGAFDRSFDAVRDGFIARVGAANGALLESTFLGGENFDDVHALAMDQSNNVYVAGSTSSSDFATTIGAFDRSYNEQTDAFVTKFPAVTLAINDVSIDENAGTATFTITKSGQTSQSVDVFWSTANGSAIAPGDYADKLDQFLSIPAAQTTATLTVAVNDDTIDEPDETFEVRINSPNATVTDDRGTATIRDNDIPPVSLSINNGSVSEGTANATLQVTKTGANSSNVTVNYATADGTATAGQDYTSASGTLVFSPSNASATMPITIPIINDNLDEVFLERFFVNLSGAVGASVSDAQGNMDIADNDVPSLLITDGFAGESGSAIFTVSKGGPQTPFTVTVNFATANVTATAGQDYTSVAGTLTFAPNETRKEISVPIIEDIIDEPEERFDVNLSGATNATISDSRGIGRIVDDDGPPSFSVADVDVDETAGQATFNVTKSGQSQGNVSVEFATDDETAVEPDDYTATKGTLTFNPNDTTKAVTVPIIDDALVEDAETFELDLFNPVDATISDGHAVATVTSDDAPPVLAIDDVAVVEGDKGVRNVAEFTVKLSFASTEEVRVSFRTGDGTAISFDRSKRNRKDYFATAGELVFAPGETTKTIPVVLRGDLKKNEANETFAVDLFNAAGATVGDGEAVGTILADD